MKIISFAWTIPAVLDGRKTVTRRKWTDKYARQFRVGHLVQAWDKSPRCGGKKIAIIQIMDIRQEKLIDITDEEEKKEGGLWGNAGEFISTWLDNYAKNIGDYDRLCNELIYRIEFKVISKE